MTILTTVPSMTFASGSGATRPTSLQDLNRFNSRHPALSTTPAPQIKIAEIPYNLGKALFSGKYNFGKPKLTAVNAAEKKQRLVILQKALPQREREKMNPAGLAGQLTDREMNALEYYLTVRFGKSIDKPPSWAEQEPPPKLAYTE